MTEYNNNFERELDWEDEIVEDSTPFVQLTPGDYQFTVTKVERGRYNPKPNSQGKLPACNKATVTVEIETAEGNAVLTHNLFLHSSTEGMLSAFFGAIGMKKHGEPLRMNWNIIGATGVCRVNKRKGTGDYADKEYDNIKSMIYRDEVDWTKVLNANVAQSQQSAGYQATSQPSYQQNTYKQPAQPTYSQPNYQQPSQQPQQPAGYQAGQF